MPDHPDDQYKMERKALKLGPAFREDLRVPEKIKASDLMMRAILEQDRRHEEAQRTRSLVLEEIPRPPTLAASVCKNLHTLINEFNDSLDNAHEVGLSLARFGQQVVFHVDSIEYCEPWLIVFRGRNEVGERVQLIQHATQVDFLLLAAARHRLEEPKGQIGFHCLGVGTGGSKEFREPPVPPVLEGVEGTT